MLARSADMPRACVVKRSMLFRVTTQGVMRYMLLEMHATLRHPICLLVGLQQLRLTDLKLHMHLQYTCTNMQRSHQCSYCCCCCCCRLHSHEVLHIDVPIAAAAVIIAAAAAADFIYSEYLTTQRKTEFKRLVWQIAQDYSNAALLLRLPGYVPMPAFTAIEDVPLVVRHARKFPAQVSCRLCCALNTHFFRQLSPVVYHKWLGSSHSRSLLLLQDMRTLLNLPATCCLFLMHTGAPGTWFAARCQARSAHPRRPQSRAARDRRLSAAWLGVCCLQWRPPVVP
jgi:hypothetical protein